MIRNKSLKYALLLALGVFLTTSGHAQQPQPAPRGCQACQGVEEGTCARSRARARAQGAGDPEGRQ